MKKKRMRIVFEGQSNQIDANTLINVLIHYQTVITEANKELGGGAKTIDLKVNAIQKGSFIIDVSLVENLKQIFTGENVGYVADLCAVVGGVYGAYKLLKGKPARTEEQQKAISIKGDGNNVTYNKTIINVYNQPIVRESISKSIETADADANVEGLRVDSDNNNPVLFEKKNFKEYIYDDFDSEKSVANEQIETVDALLTIIALNFEPGSRWQFIYNGFKIQMIVKDDALMKKIDEGERFGKGDAIHVVPGTVHAADGGILIAEIQESSDMTFRLYDWGREFNPKTARKMHLDEAIDLINYGKFDDRLYHKGPLWEDGDKGDGVIRQLVKCPQFTVNEMKVNSPLKIEKEKFGGFIIYMCINGGAAIQVPVPDGKGGKMTESTELKKGETVLVPADMPDFVIVPTEKDTLLVDAMVERQEEVDNYINPNTEPYLEGEDYEGINEEEPEG